MVSSISGPSEEVLGNFISRYVKLLFSFCLSYGAYNREQAFQITVSSAVSALHDEALVSDERKTLEALFRYLLAVCEQIQPAGAPGLSAFGPLPSTQQPSLGIVHEALMRVSKDDRALLLLRDQCHLPFELIAAIKGIAGGAKEARSACLSARERFRARVEETLKAPGKQNGL